jgi:hypothetical protein
MYIQQGFGIPGSGGNIGMPQGCLQGYQITAFFQKGIGGKRVPKIVKSKAFDAQVFQKC